MAPKKRQGTEESDDLTLGKSGSKSFTAMKFVTSSHLAFFFFIFPNFLRRRFSISILEKMCRQKKIKNHLTSIEMMN
jgi:hypothetical protein